MKNILYISIMSLGIMLFIGCNGNLSEETIYKGENKTVFMTTYTHKRL